MRKKLNSNAIKALLEKVGSAENILNMSMQQVAADVTGGESINLTIEYKSIPKSYDANVPADAIGIAMGIQIHGSTASTACLIKAFLDNHPTINEYFKLIQTADSTESRSVDRDDHSAFQMSTDGSSLFNDDDDDDDVFNFNDFIKK
tara:strand:+ start:2540 stop:2980 length:441 start_codon:yes stop_codon:yes gene_type:complete